MTALAPLFAGSLTRMGAATGLSDCNGNSCDLNLPKVAAGSQQINQLVTIGMAVVGAIAVLMFMIAALHFITAQGDPQEVVKARNTLLYTTVGVVVIVASEAIVAFALGYL